MLQLNQERVTGRTAALVARAVRRMRGRLLALAWEHRGDRQGYLAALARELGEQEPKLAGVIRETQLMTWLSAARHTASLAIPEISTRTAPEWPTTSTRPPPPPIPPPLALPEFGQSEPRLVQILKAADYLRTRIDFTPDEFEALDDGAKQLGLTVARAASTDVVRRVREALAENVAQGQTLGKFRETIEEAIAQSLLSESQVESVYRTQLGRAYSSGQRAVLNHPLVKNEFPYLLYSATHDARVRPDHLAMERLGLDGTAVYRADDPAILRFYPPWSWNCRCVVIPISVETAAARGVWEAIEWKRTGRPPIFPKYVNPPPFDLPRGWVPVGQQLVAA